MRFSELIGRYAGETAWIVGKGPSLAFLRDEHFGAGPVMAINEAVLVVQDLGLSNHLYGMNKDGCRNESKGHECPMVSPHSDTALILQTPDFSEYCFPNHPIRFVVNPVDELGFEHPAVMSVRMCIAIAKLMGCEKIILVCCDSLVNGDVRIYDGQQTKFSSASDDYLAVILLVKKDLQDIAHEYILPRKKEIV